MFQVTISRHGITKVLKNAIDRRPHAFDNAIDAQTFADSCFANQRCDYRNQGKRLPIYRVVEVT